MQLIREQQRALAVNDVEADVQHVDVQAGRCVALFAILAFYFFSVGGLSHLHRRFSLRV